MALARTGRSQRSFNYWPSFVDALSTMLLVIIFLLSVFMLAQFFLSTEVTGKDTALARLNRQVAELTSLLALARSDKADTQANLAALTATLKASEKEKARLQGLIDADNAGAGAASGRAAAAAQALDAEKQISARALAQVDILNEQIAAMRRQLSALEDALSASEKHDQESEAKIADLGSRLNVALARKVQQLARYRSDFFGRLREILGNRPGIHIAGDRFVFDAKVLFDTDQAALNPQGRAELDQLAVAEADLEREIPPQIPWVMQVNGYTDKRPITGGPFKSNWELSAARAIAVVKYLISKGADPHHLAAAGFGAYQPVDTGNSQAALARNRRIELKITEP